MHLYYDRVSKMFTLHTEDEDEPVVFLGPITNALVNLKHSYDFTDSQAREAVLQAVFNMGDSVDLETIKKIATYDTYFKKSTVSEI